MTENQEVFSRLWSTGAETFAQMQANDHRLPVLNMGNSACDTHENQFAGLQSWVGQPHTHKHTNTQTNKHTHLLIETGQTSKLNIRCDYFATAVLPVLYSYDNFALCMTYDK